MKFIEYRGMKIFIAPGRRVFTKIGEPDKVLGTARQAQRVWLLRIPNHEWDVTPDMPVARLNRIAGAKIKKVPVLGFPSWQACAKEIDRVIGGAK